MNINMEHKNIVATIYLKDGKAIKARDNYEEYPDVIELAKLYNDSGIDKIMIFDLSTTDEEHERNIQVIRNINRNIEIKVCAGGNINRMEDIKKVHLCRMSSSDRQRLQTGEYGTGCRGKQAFRERPYSCFRDECGFYLQTSG